MFHACLKIRCMGIVPKFLGTKHGLTCVPNHISCHEYFVHMWLSDGVNYWSPKKKDGVNYWHSWTDCWEGPWGVLHSSGPCLVTLRQVTTGQTWEHVANNGYSLQQAEQRAALDDARTPVAVWSLPALQPWRTVSSSETSKSEAVLFRHEQQMSRGLSSSILLQDFRESGWTTTCHRIAREDTSSQEPKLAYLLLISWLLAAAWRLD